MSHILAAILLVMAWLGCLGLARQLAHTHKIERNWSTSIIFATVLFGALLTLVVELCSIMGSFNRAGVLICWLLLDSAFLWFGISLVRKHNGPVFGTWKNAWVRVRQESAQWPLEAKCMLAATGLIVSFLLGLAITTPTTNWDSMTYHLPRIMHWIQQGSTDHFPTDNGRQIEFGPWNAYAMANLILLGKGDQLVNLVQWSAMAISLFVLCRLATGLRQWNLRTRNSHTEVPGQSVRLTAFTALLAVTLPIGLVESITTQNDYVTALWTLCLAAFLLLLLAQPDNGWYMLGAGLSLGLGMLTKSITAVYAGPLILCAGGWLLLKSPTTKARFRLLAIIGLCFFFLNAPHFIRNQLLMGSPLGSSSMVAHLTNAKRTPAVALSNVIRNLALNTNTGIEPLTRLLNSGLSSLHQWTGQDINDPATTYYYCRFRFVDQFFLHDSEASNHWHLLLLLLAAGLLALKPGQNRPLLLYAGIFVASFVLFCGYLKWQKWHSRMHLTYFLAFIPWGAVLLTEQCSKWLPRLAACLLLIATVHSVLHNRARPIFDPAFVCAPREQQYVAVYGRHAGLELSRVADFIMAAGCQTVGLKLHGEDAEYALWVMLRNRGFKGAIHHYFVEHESGKIPVAYGKPDVLLTSYSVVPQAVTDLFPRTQRIGHFKMLWPVKEGL